MTKTWVNLFLCLILLIAIIIGSRLYRLIYSPMPMKTTHLVVQVDKSYSAAKFVHTLKSHGLIEFDSLFLLWIRLNGMASQLKAGIYDVQPGESAAHILKRVIDGDVMRLTFPIIEGTTLSQIKTQLSMAPYLTYNSDVWDKIKGPYKSPEGLLLADTYSYMAGFDGQSMLLQAHQYLQTYLEEQWATRAKGLPYKSAYEMLIAASILEKETALANERRLISGVIANRLHKNMRLQMDPTVIYALGKEYKGDLRHRDLSIDSPFNTYRVRGLPPTPIAMVGKASIFAAAHPAQSNFLYFVAKGDGSHHFSETYEEQKKAIARYQRHLER